MSDVSSRSCASSRKKPSQRRPPRTSSGSSRSRGQSEGSRPAREKNLFQGNPKVTMNNSPMVSTLSVASVPNVSRARDVRNARAGAAVRGLVAGALLAACAIAQPVWAASVDSLIKAVKFDDVSAVKKQLAQGADPNTVDNTGTPIIVIAAREKSDKVGQLLADNSKTDLEKLDPAGENAM